MSNPIMYRQCRLVRQQESGQQETVSWLPTQIKSDNGKITLSVGGIVDLKREDGTWDRGWTVQSMGHEVKTPPDYRALIKGHRNLTGDNLPKVV